MTIIHMDTEQVAGVIQRMNKAILEIDQEIGRLRSSKNKVEINWYGDKASAAFSTQMNGHIKKLTATKEALEDLERRTRMELQEWLDADAHFSDGFLGSGGVGTVGDGADLVPVLTIEALQRRMCGAMSGDALDRCLFIWGNPPANAEQLAYLIQSLPESMPIVIMDIGNGEYLVLMRGTTPGWEEGSNWGSAFEAMFGSSSYQNSVVAALNNANLPENAVLHLAGHSQGGMIAQNLVFDERINFQIDSVTMFGSPDTFSEANPDVKYVSFEAEGDIVPKLDDSQFINSLFGKNKERFNDVSNLAERHIINTTADSRNKDPRISHRVYDDPGLLEPYDLPFNAVSWNAISQESSQISTLGPVLYGSGKLLFDDMKMVVEDVGSVVNVVVNGIVGLGVI